MKRSFRCTSFIDRRIACGGLLAGAFLVGMTVLPDDASAKVLLECQQGSQVGIKACLKEERQRADRALETAFNYARKRASSLDRSTGRSRAFPALLKGQSAWLIFRSEHCAFIGGIYASGPDTGAAVNACKVDVTRERADQLLGAFD